MFGWGRKGAVEKRAKLLARMVPLIVHGLQTQTYEQFVASFSNPGEEPVAIERSSGKLHFQMRISPNCWYDAAASYPLFDEAPPDRPSRRRRRPRCVHRWLAICRHNGRPAPHLGTESGRDVRVMVRSLTGLPGFRSFSAIERSLGI